MQIQHMKWSVIGRAGIDEDENFSACEIPTQVFVNTCKIDILAVSPVELDIARLHDFIREHLLKSYRFCKAQDPGVAAPTKKIQRMIAE